MDLSPSESFSMLYTAMCADDYEAECEFNVVDTLLFYNGQPYRWLYTSETTGLVNKKSGLNWTIDDIKAAFRKRLPLLKSKRVGEYYSKLAMIWYIEAPKKIIHRVVDEKELDYLLSNKFFVQYITAVQIYFGGYPLKGSGWFEHRVWLSDKGREMHETFELVLPPPQPDIGDLHMFLSNFGTTVLNSVAALPSDTTTARAPDILMQQNKLLITEAQDYYLRKVSSKLISHIQDYVHSKVVNIKIFFGFNSTWAPFIISASDVQLREVPSHIELMRAKMFGGFDLMFTRELQASVDAANIILPSQAVQETHSHPTTHELTHHHTYITNSASTSSQPKPFLKKTGRFDSMNVIPSFEYEKINDQEDPVNGAEEPRHDIIANVGVIPQPSSRKIGSSHGGKGTDFTRWEETPVSATNNKSIRNQISGAAFDNTQVSIPQTPTFPKASSPTAKNSNAKRPVGSETLEVKVPDHLTTSALQNYGLAYGIGYRTNSNNNTADLEVERRKEQRHTQIMNSFKEERSRNNIIQIAMDTKNHFADETKATEASARSQQITENWSRRIKAYPSQVRGSMDESWQEYQKNLRPLSAPPSRTQEFLARSVNGQIPTGHHGKMENTRKSTGIEKRLPAYKISAKCHGEFCSLSPIIVKAIQARMRRKEEEKRIKEEAEEKEKRDALLKNNMSNGNTASNQNRYFNFGILVNSALREAAEKQREIDAKNLEEAKIAGFTLSMNSLMDNNHNINHSSTEKPKRLKSANATHEIPCKSILLAQAESKFTDFNYLDIVNQYTEMGFELEDILSECAFMALTAVAEKCREESYRLGCTWKNTPDYSNFNSIEAAHRKLVYTEALSKVHPSKFYLTVPVCETCFTLYSSMDSQREVVVFLRHESNFNVPPIEMRSNTLHDSTSTQSLSLHNVVSAESLEGNSYYKKLQKTMSKLSRGSSDATHSFEQNELSERLAEPKRLTNKFQGENSPVKNNRPSNNNDLADSDVIANSRSTKVRPKSAFVQRHRDQFLDKEFSYRRSSKMPVSQAGVKRTTSMKKSSDRAQFGKSNIRTKKELPNMQNHDSYFINSIDEDFEEKTDTNINDYKSSFLLLSSAVPLKHSPHGPNLGEAQFQQNTEIPSKGNSVNEQVSASNSFMSVQSKKSDQGSLVGSSSSKSEILFVDGPPPTAYKSKQMGRISVMHKTGIPIAVPDGSGRVVVYSNK